MDKYLIINADDFGWDADTYKSTVSLFERGSLTSASIMTGMSATPDAINYAKENQERFSFGLHFNILDGHKPKYNSAKNSLTDSNGRFKFYNQQVIDTFLFKIKKEDVQHELEMQLLELVESGINVSHVDTHGHVHKFPLILSAMIPVVNKYKIKIIRAPQNLFQVWKLRKAITNCLFSSFFRSIVKPDHFFTLERHDNEKWFEKICTKIKSGITELGVHPGDEELWRSVEKQPLIESNFKSIISKNGIKLVNFYVLKG